MEAALPRGRRMEIQKSAYNRCLAGKVTAVRPKPDARARLIWNETTKPLWRIATASLLLALLLGYSPSPRRPSTWHDRPLARHDISVGWASSAI